MRFYHAVLCTTYHKSKFESYAPVWACLCSSLMPLSVLWARFASHHSSQRDEATAKLEPQTFEHLSTSKKHGDNAENAPERSWNQLVYWSLEASWSSNLVQNLLRSKYIQISLTVSDLHQGCLGEQLLIFWTQVLSIKAPVAEGVHSAGRKEWKQQHN